MSIDYAIQAEVIDIRVDKPKQDDSFLVDTNVWFWLTYTRASQSATLSQIAHYPNYIAKAVSKKSKLFHCGLSIAELAHLIEETERELFEQSVCPVKPKEYRHNYKTERVDVVAEIQTAWSQVKNMSASIDLLIDKVATEKVLSELISYAIDGNDLFILEAVSKAGLYQIITDDGDFGTIPNIQVFTANQTVIRKAQSQGKLRNRDKP